jgi:hypothetical protein
LCQCFGAGVTVITHGYSSDVNGWVSGMAEAIPNYGTFPGTNYTIYKLTLTTDGNGNYFYQSVRDAGVAPLTSNSGEIMVKLDWSQMAGGLSAPYDISTYDVAWVASSALMQTNAIPELGGHPLVELPLHLIGHSRGGSLVSEISRLLGTNGIWIDHLTTLDPHPLNNDGNNDPFFPTDASANSAYANVLFCDNFWQDFPDGLFDFNGEAVSGAFNRHLTDLSGGYNNASIAAPYHSNVHLWYHGTVALSTPASDTEATVTSTERQAWWTADERAGMNAGFEYSLIGKGNRLSLDQPLGPGSPAIQDGYNQMWDLGAGVSNNRTALSSNSGQWPNIIKLHLAGTNVVAAGEPIAAKFYFQYGRAASTAKCQLYLDEDANPYNANSTLVFQSTLTNTGTASVRLLSANLDTTAAVPGVYRLFARLQAGTRTRLMYAPQVLKITPSRIPPTLDIASASPTEFLLTVNGTPGQQIAIQASTDLQNWSLIATNTLAGTVWEYTNTPTVTLDELFYRAVLLP